MSSSPPSSEERELVNTASAVPPGGMVPVEPVEEVE